MKTITLLTVVAMLLMEIIGPKSSVGGSMGFMIVFVAVMLTVAVYEAWSNNRGAFGWIVNIVCSIFGGLTAIAVIGMGMEAMLLQLHLEGTFASWQHPMKYGMVVVIAILMVIGSWLPLQIANRFRATAAP